MGSRVSAPVRQAGRAAHVTVIVLLTASIAVGIVANVFLPVLLRDSPVLMLALQSSYPQMALASARLEPEVLIAVATARRWVGEVIAYAAGRVLGADALAWFARRRQRTIHLPTEVSAGWRWVRDLVVLVVSHPIVSASAGVLGMPWLRFAVLRLVGGTVWVAAVWYLAGELSVPLSALATAIETNARVLTAVAVLATAGWLWWRRSQRKARASGQD